MVKEGNIREDLFPYLPSKAVAALKYLPAEDLSRITEIRLRLGRPLSICFGTKLFCLGERGDLSGNKDALTMTEDDLREAWRLVTASSVYALEEELKRGYITLKGGHRVGLAGTAVWKDGRVKTQKNIASLNYRFARAFPDCGLPLFPFLFQQGNFGNTLLFSPPGCGKTTLLRDLTRLLSEGSCGFLPRNTVVVDERGEIAASDRGCPRYEVGAFTDVLNGFPKSEGMLLALRSLGPSLIVTDEIGTEEDRIAVTDAVRCGVDLLLTAHGGSLAELQSRPILKDLLRDGVFHHLVSLGSVPQPGTVCAIYHRISSEGSFAYVEDSGFSSSCHHHRNGRYDSRGGSETTP